MVRLTDSIKGAIFPANIAMQIYKQFKKREVMARKKFQGNLDVSQDLNIGVQVYARTKEELFPTLKKFSKVAEKNSNVDASVVEMQRTFTEVDDPDQKEVLPNDQRKAFFYGKQLVPVSTENESVLKGQVAPKLKKEGDGDGDAEMDDDGKPVKPEDVAMGLNGDVEKQFKMLGFAD